MLDLSKKCTNGCTFFVVDKVNPPDVSGLAIGKPVIGSLAIDLGLSGSCVKTWSKALEKP